MTPFNSLAVFLNSVWSRRKKGAGGIHASCETQVTREARGECPLNLASARVFSRVVFSLAAIGGCSIKNDSIKKDCMNFATHSAL